MKWRYVFAVSALSLLALPFELKHNDVAAVGQLSEAEMEGLVGKCCQGVEAVSCASLITQKGDFPNCKVGCYAEFASPNCPMPCYVAEDKEIDRCSGYNETKKCEPGSAVVCGYRYHGSISGPYNNKDCDQYGQCSVNSNKKCVICGTGTKYEDPEYPISFEPQTCV
jgi:hypothetical protein